MSVGDLGQRVLQVDKNLKELGLPIKQYILKKEDKESDFVTISSQAENVE